VEVGARGAIDPPGIAFETRHYTLAVASSSCDAASLGFGQKPANSGTTADMILRNCLQWLMKRIADDQACHMRTTCALHSHQRHGSIDITS
jgi:hypothetical protein